MLPPSLCSRSLSCHGSLTEGPSAFRKADQTFRPSDWKPSPGLVPAARHPLPAPATRGGPGRPRYHPKKYYGKHESTESRALLRVLRPMELKRRIIGNLLGAIAGLTTSHTVRTCTLPMPDDENRQEQHIYRGVCAAGTHLLTRWRPPTPPLAARRTGLPGTFRGAFRPASAFRKPDQTFRPSAFRGN